MALGVKWRLGSEYVRGWTDRGVGYIVGCLRLNLSSLFLPQTPTLFVFEWGFEVKNELKFKLKKYFANTHTQLLIRG